MSSGRKRALVSGCHRLEHVQRLAARDLRAYELHRGQASNTRTRLGRTHIHNELGLSVSTYRVGKVPSGTHPEWLM